MADPVSFLNLLEQSQQIEYLLSLPEVDEDEKQNWSIFIDL